MTAGNDSHGCLSTFLVLLSLSVLGGCERTPSVGSLVEDNRVGITTYLQRVAAVRGQLSSAPTEAGGFDPGAGITRANTVIVVEEEFLEIRSDRNEDLAYDWGPPQGRVRASTTDDLGYLVDQVRRRPPNPPDMHVEVMQRALGMMAATRFVAVPRTTEVTSGQVHGNTFTGSSWNGLVPVWSLAENRWVGAVRVSVTDLRDSATYSNVTGPVGRVVDRTIGEALDSGADTEGVIQ